MSTTSNILTLLAVVGAGAIAFAILKAKAAARAGSEAKCLRKVDPSFVSEVQWLALQERPRGISELLKEHEILRDKLWYGHHEHLEWQIEKGKVKLVTSAEWDALMAKDRRSHSKYVVESEIKLGRVAAKRMEKKYGMENLGPWSAFDWGMMNGKPSALRWMMGDEWDMLDL